MCPAGRLRDPRRRARDGQRRRDRQLHELRAVRRDHRQGRSPDDARGRRRAAVPDHLSARRERPRARDCGAPLRSMGADARACCLPLLLAARRRPPPAGARGAPPSTRRATLVGCDAAARRRDLRGDDARARGRADAADALHAAGARPARRARVERAWRPDASTRGSTRRPGTRRYVFDKHVAEPRAPARPTACASASAGATPPARSSAARARRTEACRQPDRGRTCAPTRHGAAGRRRPGRATYVVGVVNRGRTAGAGVRDRR